MSDKLKLARMIQVSGVLALSISTPAFAAKSVKINDLMIAASIPDAQRDATMKAVQAFYDFWNTGDETLLKEAVALNFTDHTLTVEKMIVAGDYVTVHMHFTGHFTGKFGQTQGKGQPVPFVATDLVKIENGRITDNWHIEDNLTLLQEMGVARVD